MDKKTNFNEIKKGIVGENQPFKTPYGEQKMVYLDWTASGRLYKPIEEKILHEIAPFMGNTHTESNVTGGMMTKAYEHAKEIIKKHVHANEKDVIIFSGTGVTGAINKMQRILGLKVHEDHKHQFSLEEEEKPVVFITHMEHHSNHISWLETIAEVVIVPANEKGNVCLDSLQSLLAQYEKRPLKIGSFSACSNVTGIKTPYHDLAKIMHEHGGICMVDFAASAPYVEMNMHPDDPMEKLDILVFSPHKFLGGPGTSGVLVFDSSLYGLNAPEQPGGGTVYWTNPWGGRAYLSDIESREDGGTPGILQVIKTALAVTLKEEMGVRNMEERENILIKRLYKKMGEIKGIELLGGETSERIGILSFYIKGVHHQFVTKHLNDKYGIQVRGGCSCAGTYGHFLLQIDRTTSKKITDQIDQGDFGAKPGWVRVSIHPTTTEEEIDYFVASIKQLIKEYPLEKENYRYDTTSNEFVHHEEEKKEIEQWFHLKKSLFK